MLGNKVLVLTFICIGNVLGNPHQAIKLARKEVASSSSYSGQDPPRSSTNLLSTISTVSISISRTVTIVTTGIAGSTLTEIEFPSIDSIGNVVTITSTLSDAGNVDGGVSDSTPLTGVSTMNPSSSSISSSNSPPALTPSCSSTPKKQHPTKTMSGGSLVETLTLQPNSGDVLVYFFDNPAKEVEYVEVRFSTWYKSAGAGKPTNIVPDIGDQGMATASTSTTTPSKSNSDNAGAVHQNGNRKGNGGNSRTLSTVTKSKI